MDGYAENSLGTRAVALWGHLAPELLCGCIGAVIVLRLLPPPGALVLTVPIALIVFVLATWVMMRRHDRRLCEQCVASLPLNAAAEAGRYRRRFWMAHTGSERRFLVPYLVVLLGSNFAPGPVGRIFWAVVQASMIYLILSQVTHRRLQPWCPWCSAGGGGSKRGEHSPDPVLSGR